MRAHGFIGAPKERAVSVTPVIDAIEGDGWRQEIRRELLCKLQQKLSASPRTQRSVWALFRDVLFETGVHDSDFVHAAAS
jgi:hypothetical protein